MLELNKIHCGDNCDLLGQLPRECIDLVVTSPPYDDPSTDAEARVLLEPLVSCGTCVWWQRARGGYAEPHGSCRWGERNKAPEWAKAPQFRLHYQGKDCVMRIEGLSFFPS